MAESNFDKDEALQLLKDVIAVNTVNPPGNEVVLAKKLQALFLQENISADVVEFKPGRANLIARLPGAKKAPALMLTGHLDTVPVGNNKWEHDPFSAEIVGDLIYGRGISDMKGSVAAMIYAMFLLKRANITPPQDIVFLGTAGEETNCLGSNDFVSKGGMKEIGAVLVGEPSNAEMLIAHKGAAWVNVNFYGKTAHGSMPDLGINAIYQMARFIECLQQETFACEPDINLGKPTFSVNVATGGVATNVVADFASCTIDIRTIPGQTEKDVKALLDAALVKAAEGNKNFKSDYEFILSELPVACPPNHPILDALDKAAGEKLLRRGVNYYTDASVLVGDSNLPMVIYGPGDDKQAHQPNEHISLTKYYRSIEVYKNFMCDFCIEA